MSPIDGLDFKGVRMPDPDDVIKKVGKKSFWTLVVVVVELIVEIVKGLI